MKDPNRWGYAGLCQGWSALEIRLAECECLTSDVDAKSKRLQVARIFELGLYILRVDLPKRWLHRKPPASNPVWFCNGSVRIWTATTNGVPPSDFGCFPASDILAVAALTSLLNT